MRHRLPIEVQPSSRQLAPIRVPSPMVTSGPIMVLGPISTPRPDLGPWVDQRRGMYPRRSLAGCRDRQFAKGCHQHLESPVLLSSRRIRLSTRIESSSASATRSLPTKALPAILQVFILSLSSSSSNLHLVAGKNRLPELGLVYGHEVDQLGLGVLDHADRSSTPPTCAIASIISTAGIIGWPGKWPTKKGSFMVTFLMPTTRLPSSR